MKSKKYLLIIISAVMLAVIACGQPQVSEVTETTKVSTTQAAEVSAGVEQMDGHDISNMSQDDREDYLDTFEYTDISRSTAIDRIGYSDTYGDLYVRFLDSQKEYAYTDVSENTYLEFLDAESIGKYYNSNIKGQYDCIRLFD